MRFSSPVSSWCLVVVLNAGLAGCSTGADSPGSTGADVSPAIDSPSQGGGVVDGTVVLDAGGGVDAEAPLDVAVVVPDTEADGQQSAEDTAVSPSPGDAGAEDVGGLVDGVAVVDSSEDVVLVAETVEGVDGDAVISTNDVLEGDEDVASPSGIGELCFSEILDPEKPGPNYDQYAPIVGSHCVGTNHQDIVGVEQVVILGDSVTQGTPNDVHPTCIDNQHFYRNELAEWLTTTYDLDQGDSLGWGLFKAYSCLYDGTAGQQTSGDFHNCSKWGARTDDLIAGGGQVPQCFPSYPGFGSDKTTLVFFTMGGNDISNISQAGSEASAEEVAAGYPAAWALAESTVGYLEETMAFFKDPAMFPNGAYVVFANPFEFTDGTGQTSACSPSEITIPFVGTIDISAFGIDLAGLAGYGAWEDQSVQEAIVIWILEQYMRIAVDYQVDLVWLLESFCGHGYVATGPDADPEGRCYRGPDSELYFDITCIHPNDAGHHALSELFKAVIAE